MCKHLIKRVNHTIKSTGGDSEIGAAIVMEESQYVDS